MGVFEGAQPVANSRSNARLNVSQVFSPAERWIHDPTLPRLFEYSYGGPGWVVLSKGTIVAFADEAVEDWETRREMVPITYANGINYPIGILPYNVYQKEVDRLRGNQPAIETHQYIELPLIKGIQNVYNLTPTGSETVDELKDMLYNTIDLDADLATNMKMHWGCYYAYNDAEYATLKPGDFLKSDKFGKFVKWYPEQRTVSASVDFSHSQEFNTRFLTQIVVEQSEVEYELEEPALAIYSASIGDVPLVYGTDYELTADGKFKILTTQSAGTQIDVWAHKTTYHLEHSNAWDISVTAQGTELDPTEFTYTPATGNVVISIPGITSPWATTITIEYCAPGAMQMNITDTKTGDSPVQIVGQVLAMEVDMPPLGWLKWVTPVVETDYERRTDVGNKYDPPNEGGYAYDADYADLLKSVYNTNSPWKDYAGIPGLTDGAISGLGPGILPGWDFLGSVGAIRIALRY